MMIETKFPTQQESKDAPVPIRELSAVSLGRVSDILMVGTLVGAFVAVLEISVPAIVLAAATGVASAVLKLAISRH